MNIKTDVSPQEANQRHFIETFILHVHSFNILSSWCDFQLSVSSLPFMEIVGVTDLQLICIYQLFIKYKKHQHYQDVYKPWVIWYGLWKHFDLICLYCCMLHQAITDPYMILECGCSVQSTWISIQLHQALIITSRRQKLCPKCQPTYLFCWGLATHPSSYQGSWTRLQ